MKFPTYLLKTGTEMSLIEELWEAFVYTYFNGGIAYENLDFGGVISPQLLIIGLFAGLAVAAFASVVNKQINGAFVARLLENDCLSPEGAKTLSELDSAHVLSVRMGLKHGVNLRRVVRCREEDEHLSVMRQKEEEYAAMRAENPKLPKRFTPKPFRVDLEKHHFYIPEDMKGVAQVKFERRGNSVMSAIIWGGVILVAFVALVIFLPSFLGLLDALVGSFN